MDYALLMHIVNLPLVESPDRATRSGASVAPEGIR
jgi:hypothetical protein